MPFQRHADIFWILRYSHLKFHTPIGMLVLSRWIFFFNFVTFCGYKYQCTFCVQVGCIWYSLEIWTGHYHTDDNGWLNYVNMDRCKKIAIGSLKILWLKSKKWIDKIWTKTDWTVEFSANHIYLIMGNYLVKSFFIILPKNVVNY